MSVFKRAVAATIAVTMIGSSALAAETLRPSDSLIAAPAAGANLAIFPTARVGHKVPQENDLLGAPLFLAFLGAVAITIGTIIIINHNGRDHGHSPG